MNYIQQNAIDLCAGLRQMKWDRLEQEMLRAPVPDNFDYARQSDLGFYNEAAPLSEAAFNKQLPSSPNPEAVHVITGPTHSADLDEDTSYLPKQIRNRIDYINRTYGARTGEFHV